MYTCLVVTDPGATCECKTHCTAVPRTAGSDVRYSRWCRKAEAVPFCDHENNSENKETHKCSADIQQLQNCKHIITVLHSNGLCDVFYRELYFRREDRVAVVNTRGADKSLARPERKQATATENFDVHISYL